ncbi:MAG: hypothetical protein DME23_00085 [Verrucomicrobia bacterium]|nr:MAG: hypothetical protein DME23_00085 [Verrucomicrobiota bacterium]
MRHFSLEAVTSCARRVHGPFERIESRQSFNFELSTLNGKNPFAVNIELINTGSELMLGRVLNTHQQWIGRQLADRGYVVTRQVSVPDSGSDVQQAVREALSRADLVIATGGLGPTSDDITRDLVAELLGKKLREDAVALANVERSCSITSTAPRPAWPLKSTPIHSVMKARRAG